jgi:hypothetical protein
MEENWKLTSQSIQVTTSMHESIYSHHWHSCNAAILIMQEFMCLCLKWYYLKMSDSESTHLWIKPVSSPYTRTCTNRRSHTHTHTQREKLLVLRCVKVCECLKYCTQKFRMSKTTHTYYTREQIYIKNQCTLTQVPQNVLSVFICVLWKEVPVKCTIAFHKRNTLPSLPLQYLTLWINPLYNNILKNLVQIWTN